MSNRQDESINEVNHPASFRKVNSNHKIDSQKQLNPSKEDLNTLILSQNLQRSTYINDEDLDEDTEETHQHLTPNSHLLTSVHAHQKKKSEVQRPKQPKNYASFNIEKSITQQNVEPHVQHQQIYQSISSDHSSEEKQQKPKQIKKQLQQTLSENHPNPFQNLQSPPSKKQSFTLIKSQSIKQQELKSNEYPVLNSEKYNVSLKKDYSLEDNHATFELSRKNIHTIDRTNEPMFKRQQSYDLKQVTSQRSNRINLQKPQQNPQIKYPSSNIRSNSQQFGHLKSEAKKTKVQQTQMEFEQSKNPSTSQKNLAYVSKKFTSEQPSPKRNEEFNEVYKIEAPIPKPTKKQYFEEIKNSQQQSHLLYISASGQLVYPSLDLGRKAKQLQNRNVQAQQVKLSSNSNQNVRESRRQHEEKRRKPSTEAQIPCKIKILQYRSQYFLTIETQVFDIEVQYPPNTKVIEMKNIRQQSTQQNEEKKSDKNYRIKRRFSDFAFLYEGIATNQIGYIIYPFPSKSLQSFVKIKLQSLIGTALSDGSNTNETQKMQLLQRRIEELQNFVNFLINHDQLKYSQELGIFLCEDQQTYIRSRERIEKYIQEYRELQSSSNLLESGKKNIKKALETGFGMVMKWWGTDQQPVKDLNNKIEKSRQSRQFLVDTVPQDDIQFGQYFQTIGICLAKFQMLQRSMLKLCEINQKFISFKDIDTEFDYLVKLCAKVSSGKEYSKNLVELIEYDLIRDIEIGRRWLQQSKEQLMKRQDLKQLIEDLKSSLTYANDESSKISKLERRLERFQKNFRYGFSHLIIECEKIFEKSRLKFVEEWHHHSLNMKKIWK